MKSDGIAYGIAGILFGLIAGWIIGSQQAPPRPVAAPAGQSSQASQSSAAAPESTSSTNSQPPAVLDEAKVTAFKTVADKDPKNAEARVQLGNLYFDAERYSDAIKWYTEAFNLAPNDVNVSTDLGVCYYYTSQPDKALEQFDKSLKIDPKHAKTLLNVGIVKAFGKQDLQGALAAWQEVVQVSPDSPEGQAAKRALDSLRSAHPSTGAAKPGA